MIRIAVPTVLVLYLLLCPVASSEPGEDHWSVEVDSDISLSLNNAIDLIDSGNYNEALTLLNQLALDLPANADIQNLLGYAYRKTGDYGLSGRIVFSIRPT